MIHYAKAKARRVQPDQRFFIHSQQVLSGGRFVPSRCRAQSRVAIIVPYRNREEQLKLFLNHIHPILSRQELVYGIYVVGQVIAQNSLYS